MKKLPMIEFAASMIQEGYLEHCYILGVQHILPTTLAMFEELFKKGLRPENLSLIGKCYSSDNSTYVKMQKIGIDVCPSSINFDSYQSFDDVFQQNIHAFISERADRLNDSSFKKIIVLDDGGEFLNIIDTYLTRSDHVYGIEQTSSGYNRLRQKQHSLPIINLARAYSKLALEPSRIIDDSLQRITDFLSNHPKEIKNILVIGSGTVGTQVYSKLKDQFNVLRYDIDSKKSDILLSKFNDHLHQVDLIIGCTGSTSITRSQHKFLKPGCILASCSSSDREFDAIHLRKKVSKPQSCTEHLDIEGITLLNCGFPVNFNGQDNMDRPEFFQFIRALIIASIDQTSKPESNTGFIDLDKSKQDLLLSKFSQYV